MNAPKPATVSPEWRWSDAWIFYAIVSGRDPCTLRAIAAVTDYANHALPSLEELQAAFDRLVAAKLVKVRKAGIFTTDTAREIFAKVEATTGNNPRRRIEALEALLKCPCCGVSLGKVRARGFPDAQAWDNAYAEYMAGS